MILWAHRTSHLQPFHLLTSKSAYELYLDETDVIVSFKEKKNRAYIGVEVKYNIWQPATSVFDRNAASNMVQLSFLSTKWRDQIRHTMIMYLKCASDTHFDGIRKIMQFVLLGNICVGAQLNVIEKLAVPVVFEALRLTGFSAHPSDGTSYQSCPVLFNEHSIWIHTTVWAPYRITVQLGLW